MFPAGLFEKFIDVGHYQRDLNSYSGLVTYVNQLTVRTKLLTLTVIILVIILNHNKITK